MPRNKLSDLNNHLFEMLEMVKDGDMDLEQAKRATDIAGKIIEVKKVECQQASILVKAGYTSTVAKMLATKEIDSPKQLTNEEV